MKIAQLGRICSFMDTPEIPEPTQKRTGGLMIVLSWVVIIGLVSMLFSGFLDNKHNPNAQVNTEVLAGGEVEVRLRQNSMGHYVATGLINDVPVVFLVDTGATNVSVPAHLARQLGLEPGASMKSQTANGTVTTYQTRIAEVQLGGILMLDVRASLNPGMKGNEVLLGMSFLRHLELHQSNGRLTLTRHNF